MKNKSIVFTGPNSVEVQVLDENLEQPQAHEVLVRTRYSLISAGTELACLSGGESWFGFPSTPGYTSVGEVVRVGERVSAVSLGDMVYTWGGHKQYHRVNLANPKSICINVPAGIKLPLVPFVRMITIAMTAIRVSNIELGDFVAVAGLGLVGNFAAQLASLQGGRVIGIDLSESRVALSAKCGLLYPFVMNKSTVVESVDEITHKQGVTTLIEATGMPVTLPDVLPLVGRYGEVVLLGTPRGVHEANLTDTLSYIHLDPKGNVTFKGAHEWRYPVARDPFIKHSIERNSEIAMDLIRSEDLQVAPLLTHSLPPDEAEEAYHGLKHQRDDYVGVVFDWTDVAPTT